MREPSPVFPFVVTALLAASGLAAEEGRALTLRAARAMTLERNFDLQAARSDVDAALAQRLTARQLSNPVLDASVQKLATRARTAAAPPSPNTRDTTIAVSQLVEIGGKRRDRIRSADAGIDGARARLEFSRTRLDASVVKAYVAALVADETVQTSRASAASLSHSAEIAARRFEAGEISAAEREQVAIAAGRFEAETRTAEAAAVQAKAVLETLLGFPGFDPDLRLADRLEELLPLAARAPDEGHAQAAERRGDVRAAASAVDAARADLDLQRALRVPDPTLLAQYESDLPDNPHTVGFAVALPLPLFSRNQGGIRAAEVARDAARHRLEQTRAAALAEMAAARAAFDAARARKALLADDLLPRAERVQQTVAFAYDKGGASLLELLEAERNLNDLRLAALGTQAEMVSAAADLAAATGNTIE